MRRFDVIALNYGDHFTRGLIQCWELFYRESYFLFPKVMYTSLEDENEGVIPGAVPPK